ncbi:MAG: glycosyltransferase family 2 protein [Bacteroidales bacterium]|jgi:hypothetical protein|nr:glycosyltransferase family 2 protein [Bacteroidales bacterium]
MITCYIHAYHPSTLQTFAGGLLQPPVAAVYAPQSRSALPEGIQSTGLSDGVSTAAIRAVAERCRTEYLLLCDLAGQQPEIHPHDLKRMTDVATQTSADWVYADYAVQRDGGSEAHPVIDCQEGSLRDDFNFGALVLVRASAFREAARHIEDNYRHAALYSVRLHIARKGRILRIREPLYTCRPLETATTEQAMFAYVDPANREVQQEMERACTHHLKETGAWLSPDSIQPVNLREGNFPCEATVVIPVRNRKTTIGEAIDSALNQSASFPFNIIVADNHSDDGTSRIIREKAARSDRLLHLIPSRKDLGIGGCWNEAINHPACGRFAVQLDSDDLYSGKDTLQKIINCFHDTRAAMVIGSYLTVDARLNRLPPGIVAHSEWTGENGRNNALRINGLGAPRAFFTPLIRKTGFPNVSYGEDYAAVLAMCRRHPVGRIHDVVYLCRRWEGNSDSSLSVHRQNEHHLYKDGIRTIELLARKQMNHPGMTHRDCLQANHTSPADSGQ